MKDFWDKSVFSKAEEGILRTTEVKGRIYLLEERKLSERDKRGPK